MKNNPFNLIKYWKKHGWQKTKKEWTKNYLLLETPENLLKKEIIGYAGMIAGSALAFILFVMDGLWRVSLLFVMSIWLLYVQLKGKLISLKRLRDMEKSFRGEN